jgi:outer membrane protein assembly factor BamE
MLHTMIIRVHRNAVALLRLALPGILSVLLATGCVYRIDIQQGNFLEDKDVEQVDVGMTRSQVRYLLGTPMVDDVFGDDRWDYVYFFKKGRSRKVERRHFIVYFDQDAVVRVERPLQQAAG